MSALAKAIELAGGQSALARAINATQPTVWYWLNRRNGVVPAHWCRRVSEAVSGAVTEAELNPAVFSTPEKAA